MGFLIEQKHALCDVFYLITSQSTKKGNGGIEMSAVMLQRKPHRDKILAAYIKSQKHLTVKQKLKLLLFRSTGRSERAATETKTKTWGQFYKISFVGTLLKKQ